MKFDETKIYIGIVIIGAIMIAYSIYSSRSLPEKGIPGVEKPLNLTGVSCLDLEKELKSQDLPQGMVCTCLPGDLVKEQIEPPEGIGENKVQLGYVLSCEYQGNNLLYPIWVAINNSQVKVP